MKNFKTLVASLLIGVGLMPMPSEATIVARDIAVEWCDQLNTIAYQISWCNPQVTVDNATAVSSNSAQVVVNTTRSDKGLLYTYATTSCSTAPAVATMLAAPSRVVQGAAISVPVSGLTPSTNGYCVWAMQEWDRRYSSIVKTTSTFNTTSGAVTPPPEDDDPAQGSNAPVYYVSNSTVGCTDTGAGTSSATPWCNVNKIASLTGTTSAKVYLKSGDTWLNQTVDVNWNGILTDIGHVGCYKLVTGNPKICAAGDTDPEVHGWANAACVAAKNCPWTAWQGGVNSEYEAQFTVFSNYIDVQDITLRYAGSYAYQAYGEGNGYSNPGPGNINDVRFIRANTYDSGNSPYVLANGVRRIVVRDGIVDGYNLCLSQVKTGGLANGWCNTSAVGWPGGIAFVRSIDCDCLVENMTVTNGWGEGMNAYAQANGIVFRGNRSGNLISASPYTDASRNIVVESNISWGTQGRAGYPTGSNFGGGIVFHIEDPVSNLAAYDTINNVVRNNITIDADWNYSIGHDGLAQQANRQIGAKFYNNLALSNVGASFRSYEPDSRVVDTVYSANIEYTTDPNSEGVCKLQTPEIIMLNNIFGGAAPTGPCVRSSNRLAVPLFSVSRPYSFWDTVDYTNHTQVQMTDFIPLANSPAVGYGDPAAKDAVCIDISKHSYALANMSFPFIPDPVTWGKCRAYDMDGTLVDSTPDAGPQEITTVVTPPTPTTGYRLVSADGPVKFIRSDIGNDANNGDTPDTAWRTLYKINSALANGMNVALLNTSIFKNQEMYVQHVGLTNDWNLIAGYKLNSDGQPVWIRDEIPGPNSLDQKPVIEGNITLADIQAGNVDYSGVFPIDTYASHYDPVSAVWDTADNTELRNIAWRYHRWDTLRVGDSVSLTNRTLVNQIQEGLDFYDNGNAPYVQGVSNGVWRNGSTWNSNHCWSQKGQSPSPGSEAGCQGPNGGGFTLVNTEKYLVENNYIADMIVEGIDIFSGSNNNIIRGNYIGDVHNICIYNDSSRDTVIENNICVYNANSNVIGYANLAAPFKGGIWLDQEYYGGVFLATPNTNMLVRNNLIVNAKLSLAVSTWATLVAQDTNTVKKTSGYITGNTIIGSVTNDIDFWSYLEPGAGRIPFFYTRNNAFWTPPLGAYSCTWRTITNTSADYNHFFTPQADGDCNKVTNTSGLPGLATAAYSDWLLKNIDNNAPTFENIRPTASSPLIGTGVATQNVVLDPVAYGMGAENMDSLLKGKITLANWSKERHYSATDEVIGLTKGAMCPLTGCTGAPVTPVAATAITISPNQRYFRKNGQPFNWVGCTGWLSPTLTTADMTTYLEDQASRGCNVVHGPIMLSILDPIDFTNGPISSASPYTMRTSFFSSKIDHWVNEATRLGMNIMFPLCWGPNCKRDMVESAVNARTYANFVVERYNDYPNIIWIVAGEYTKMSTNPPNYDSNNDPMDANELSILDALIAGTVANKHPDQLVTLHPDGHKSTTDTDRHPGRNFHNETWLNFNTLQSYLNQSENILDTDYDYSLSPIKPTLQDELFYEEQAGIPGDGGSAAPWHVRIGAWAARLNGSAGFTYGHGCVWSFCTGWASQLADAGATDIFTHYKAFWDEHHSETLIKSRDWLTGDKGTNVSTPSLNTYETAMRSADSSKLIVYSPKGDNINVITNNMSGTLRARWFDPRNGGYTLISNDVAKTTDTTFDPSGSPAIDNDWVLVID